ncbi:MAG TPA: NAD(P)H-binding protein [Streptosporangiaceae bacterium]|nr:NAD(P)H-binding protein [Streptosporangiaceae bacterium]
MRIVVFGANGPTGRELVGQALAAGHQVTAVTRHPEQVAPGERLAVAGADAADAGAVSEAVAGSDAVLSALGVPYTRKPVTVYSTGTANIIAAMKDHGVRRLIVTGSAAVDPGYRASDSVLFRQVMEPLFMRLPGKTVYADNRRMEALIRASSLEWTIIRACWLFNARQVSDYQICENTIRGMFTARADLAACLLAQLADDRYVRTAVGVVTTAGTPSIVQQIWREDIKKEKRS